MLTNTSLPLDDCTLLAPVKPPHVYAIGLNYAAHVDEFKHMWSKYSMFPLIDWSRMNFNNINRVAEYVNTVDFPEQA